MIEHRVHTLERRVDHLEKGHLKMSDTLVQIKDALHKNTFIIQLGVALAGVLGTFLVALISYGGKIYLDKILGG